LVVSFTGRVKKKGRKTDVLQILRKNKRLSKEIRGGEELWVLRFE
jgi:hypothetical protein